MTEEAPSGPVIRVFGTVGLDAGGEPMSIGGPKQRRLLALLAIRADTEVTIDWLAEYLWSDAERPEAPAPAIRTYLSRLRQAFPQDAQSWIETVPSGYRLDAPTDAVEHRRFAQLRADATRARDIGDPLTAHTKLSEALTLWRGEPFRELQEFDWARADIEQLQLDRLEMLEERWEVALALGRHTQITGELAAFTAEHRHRDRAAQQHALALHRSGRTAEALRIIADFRRRLADESGLDPSPTMVELEQALLVGDPSLKVEKLGRPLRGYRLLEEIGAGAFSVVWRGEQPSVRREVAIKQIRAELAAQPEFIRRFEAEAHLVARLEHPHIVPLIDYWRDPDSAYLVMRWLRGGTLERRLDDGSLTLDETLTLARQIGGALSTAHRHGIVHRDVKTANVLFDEQGNAFLGDFGIALHAAESAGPEAALSPGSPLYAAPEQIRRERLGPEADVFSLGVVIFECLTGSLPVPPNASVGELVELQLHTEYPALAELRSDVPRGISDAVATATAKDPAARFPSIDEFLDALDGSTPVGAAEATVSGASGATADVNNPYVGLRAFDEVDTENFFGRDRLVTEMVARWNADSAASRCLVVVGPSGSGKSSVVRAGLIPALRNGAVGGSADWFTTTMVPGNDPFEALEVALLRVAVNPPASLLDQLRDGPRGIVRTVRRCLASDEDTLLLFVDQFEEVFVGRAAADADAFLHALTIAVEDPSSPLRLVVTLRADYYGRPLEHPAFAHLLTATAVDVAPLAADELERAIIEPATRAGARFESGLVARIAAEATGQPSPLPLLQFTLGELFDRSVQRVLTTAAYDEIGGLTGALALRADELYLNADDAGRTAIRTLFGRLIDPSGNSADLRRRVAIGDLGRDAATADVIDRFVAARLQTLDRDPVTREPTVEVAHEALLREWPRLVRWLDEDLNLLRIAASIGTSTDAWIDGGRSDADLFRGDRLAVGLELAADDPDRLRPVDVEFLEASRSAEAEATAVEHRRVRRLRRLVAGTAAALVVALIAGGVAITQQRRADDEADAARAAAADADLATIISRSAATVRDDPDVALLLALEANRRSPSAETEQAVLNALGSNTLATQLASHPSPADPDCPDYIIDSDGLVSFATLDGELVSQDVLTGEWTQHGPAPEECVFWFADRTLDRKVATSANGRKMWVGPYDGPFDAERTFDTRTDPALSSFRETGRMSVTSPNERPPAFTLLDDRTLATVGEPVSGGDTLFDFEVRDDGSLVVLSFGTPDQPDGDGELIVLDGVTGEERFRVTIAVPAEAVNFDETQPQLLAATIDGRLLTVDLESQEVVSNVAVSATSTVNDMEVRDDGLVTVVSAGQVEIVDRLIGPVSDPVELRGVVRSRVRPDGLILSIEPGGATSVLTLDGNSLADTVFDVGQSAAVHLDGGLAVAVDGPTPPEVIDLTTGDRRFLQLESSAGTPVTPIFMISDRDGFWTADLDANVVRWDGDTAVASVALPEDIVASSATDDRWALLTGVRGDATAHLVALDPSRPAIQLSVEVPGTGTAHPSPDDGVYTVDTRGTMSVFDADGELVREIETGLEFAETMASDPVTGRVAVTSGVRGAAIVDPTTGDVQNLAGTGYIVNLGFARDGQYLVLTSQDGTVRLWDVERNRSAGLLWDGTGARPGSPPWYDAESDSVWVTTSGQIIEIPLDPGVWVERACTIVGRDFTEEEWDRLVPGDDATVRSACG